VTYSIAIFSLGTNSAKLFSSIVQPELWLRRICRTTTNQTEHFAAEKLFFRMVGCYGAPSVAFYHRFTVEDNTSVGALIDTVWRWRVRRIVMSHGRIIDNEAGSEIFANAWARFARPVLSDNA
jgi:hypothetical protein